MQHFSSKVYDQTSFKNTIQSQVTNEFYDSLLKTHPLIQQKQKAVIIPGVDFDKKETKYKEHIPDNQDFVVYKILKEEMKDNYVRIF